MFNLSTLVVIVFSYQAVDIAALARKSRAGCRFSWPGYLLYMFIHLAIRVLCWGNFILFTYSCICFPPIPPLMWHCPSAALLSIAPQE